MKKDQVKIALDVVILILNIIVLVIKIVEHDYETSMFGFVLSCVIPVLWCAILWIETNQYLRKKSEEEEK